MGTVTYCKQIVEAHGREIGRIHEVFDEETWALIGTFFTLTKKVKLPAGKIQSYGINWRYML